MGCVLIIPVCKLLFLTHSDLSGAPCYPRASRGTHTQTTHDCRPSSLSPLASKSLQLPSSELTHNPCLSQLMNSSVGGTELFIHHCSQATRLHFNGTPRTCPHQKLHALSLATGALLGACHLWGPLEHTVYGPPTPSMSETNLIPRSWGKGEKRKGTFLFLYQPLSVGAQSKLPLFSLAAAPAGELAKSFFIPHATSSSHLKWEERGGGNAAFSSCAEFISTADRLQKLGRR